MYINDCYYCKRANTYLPIIKLPEVLVVLRMCGGNNLVPT